MVKQTFKVASWLDDRGTDSLPILLHSLGSVKGGPSKKSWIQPPLTISGTLHAWTMKLGQHIWIPSIIYLHQIPGFVDWFQKAYPVPVEPCTLWRSRTLTSGQLTPDAFNSDKCDNRAHAETTWDVYMYARWPIKIEARAFPLLLVTMASPHAVSDSNSFHDTYFMPPGISVPSRRLSFHIWGRWGGMEPLVSHIAYAFDSQSHWDARNKQHMAFQLALGGLHPSPQTVQAILSPRDGRAKAILDVGTYIYRTIYHILISNQGVDLGSGKALSASV